MISFLLTILCTSVACFFGRFLGSEVTALMTTGINLVLFSMLLGSLIFLFRLFGFHLKKKYGFRLVFFIYISILFCISFFCYFLRVYLLCRFGEIFSYPLPFLIMSAGGGQALPLPAPSDPSSSSSWTEFDMGVLSEPFSETEMEGTSLNSAIPGVAHAEAGPSHQAHFVIPNTSLEASMRNRVLALENANTPFLLDKQRGQYWSDIKADLDQALSQREYNVTLECENCSVILFFNNSFLRILPWPKGRPTILKKPLWTSLKKSGKSWTPTYG